MVAIFPDASIISLTLLLIVRPVIGGRVQRVELHEHPDPLKHEVGVDVINCIDLAREQRTPAAGDRDGGGAL